MHQFTVCARLEHPAEANKDRLNHALKHCRGIYVKGALWTELM
jgi:hypothetical protein